jgi:hypothetical protein
MKRRILSALGAAATLLTLVASTAPASAQWNRNRVVSIVDPSVTFVTTARIDGIRYRAIVLENRGSSNLLVEMENFQRRGQRMPFAQVWVDELRIQDFRIDTLNAEDFRNIHFGPRALRFETTLQDGDVACRVPVRRFDARDRSTHADCEFTSMHGRPPAVVGPDPRPIDPRPPVIVPPHHDPRVPGHGVGPRQPRPLPSTFQADLIRACSQATIGNHAMQECVDNARPIGFYAPEAIAACAQATVGNSALNECVRSVAVDSPWTAGIIQACSQATIGNSAINQCVATATRSAYDPLPVIGSCQQATIGNDAFQRCIESGLR